MFALFLHEVVVRVDEGEEALLLALPVPAGLVRGVSDAEARQGSGLKKINC